METRSFSSPQNIDKTVNNKPSAFNLLKCKCPRCRQGNMFTDANPWKLKTTMKMEKDCAVCKQPFNIEVGFYYGSGFVSYAFTIAFSVATFIAWWVLLGFSVNDNRIFYWLLANAVLLLLLQPYFMRVARTGWLAFFVHYNANWRTEVPQALERTNKEQEANW